ncbi:MAG: hypothetical protein GEU93_01005 [Propionibacteriales bacterium]|nr:hypothetical protein [Propionibacteriales bacterium]
MSTPEVATDRRAGRQISTELVGGLLMLGVAVFFRLNAGEGRLDWLFPLVLSYVLGGLGIVLLVRGIAGFGDRLPTVPPILRGQGVDVAVFILLTVAYVALMPVVGFWVMTALTIFVAAAYLDTGRSARTLVLASGVAIAVCIAGFLLMTRVFYVPFPPVRWLPFL